MTSPIEQIRNIGIIAHIDAGKTTTTERILFYAGVTHRMGNVDDGTTVTDFDPEEAKRGITIYSASVSCKWQGHTINIIDTPGHVDFTAEVERSLRVLDGGVVVFSAVEGVEAQSETVWRQADKYHVPRVCFINKMDRIGAGFDRVFGQLSERLKANPIAISIPIGEGPITNPTGFRGIIDLIQMKALYFNSAEQGKVIDVQPIPEDEQLRAEEWHGKLIDAIALIDDEAFAIYDETGDLPEDQIIRVLRKAVVSYQLQPVLCGSSLDYIGVQPILDAVVRYLPSPVDVPPVEGKNPSPKKADKIEVRQPSDKEPFCGLVFKIHADEHSELYFVRIYSGVMKSRSRVLNPRTGDKEMISQLWRMEADSREKLDEASAGDIVGMVGPKDAVTGDTLCDQANGILLETIRFPETVISMAIEPETSADRKKLEETLKVMSKQDPTFSAKISEETGQTIISGMGELHLEIISKRMERDFHIKMRTHKPRVTYRETISAKVQQEGMFDRQHAGVRQFAKVTILLDPDSSDAGITVTSKMKPNVMPIELAEIFQQALRDELKGGGLIGYPLINVKAVAVDAHYVEGETTETAIRASVADAVRQALQAVGTTLLEPVMKLEVVTPSDFVGNISADLNARHANIVNTELRGHLVVIIAEVPLAKMFGYSTTVRSLSQGRASFTMEPLRYDVAHDQQQDS